MPATSLARSVTTSRPCTNAGTGTRTARTTDPQRSALGSGSAGVRLASPDGRTALLVNGAADADVAAGRPHRTVGDHALARGSSRTVLLVLPDWPVGQPLQDYLDEATRVLDEAGYHRFGRYVAEVALTSAQ